MIPDADEKSAIARPPQIRGCTCESAVLQYLNTFADTSGNLTARLNNTGNVTLNSTIMRTNRTSNSINISNVSTGFGKTSSGARIDIVMDQSGKAMVSVKYTFYKRSGVLWCSQKPPETASRRALKKDVLDMPLAVKLDPVKTARVSTYSLFYMRKGHSIAYCFSEMAILSSITCFFPSCI